MKSWFVRGVLWGIACVATFVFTVMATSSSGSGFPVPSWVPFVALGLLFLGWAVLQRSLLDRSEA